VPSLHELQRRFAAALFDTAEAPIEAEIRSSSLDPSAALGIYRAHLHETFRGALAPAFPVIERLVGAQFFEALARQFQAAHPSHSGDLQRIGVPFPAFLRDRFHAGPYAYFADVAALEWAIEESMTAPAAPAFDARELCGIAPAHYADLHFALHPACRLVSSAYPLLPIWHANQPRSAATQVIDLASGSTCVLLLRAGARVHFHHLGAPEFALLCALASNSSLGAALDAALHADAAFDLVPVLRKLFEIGAFVGATLHLDAAGEQRAGLGPTIGI
jgi:hypothetical protein